MKTNIIGSLAALHLCIFAQAREPKIQPPEITVNMGQVSPVAYENLYSINLINTQGTVIGTIGISGHFHVEENFETVADPNRPSGPDNRTFVKTLTGAYAELNLAKNYSPSDLKAMHEIVKNINENKGLKLNSNTVSSIGSPTFTDDFTTFVKSEYNLIAGFDTK